ncbi:hypothetical protein CLBKND_02151 [Methylorubrum aminovorans]
MEPAQKLKIGSATLGILKSVPVDRGATVKAGDIIARLDSSVEEANVALSRAQSESTASIEAQLELRMIRSPIRGIVTERLMSAGEFVRQDSAIFTLVQLDPLYVEAYLPVSRWKEIALRMPATVELDQPIGGTYVAKVSVVDQVFDAASGTFGVRLELANPDFKLPGGQRCKVAFPLAAAGPLATAQPSEAR